jgi:hypothetical protein
MIAEMVPAPAKNSENHPVIGKDLGAEMVPHPSFLYIFLNHSHEPEV